VSEAVNYLFNLGHRRVAFAGWPVGSLNGEQRLQGYRDAHRERGIPLNPDFVFRGLHSENTGREALRHWLRLPLEEQPTAIMAVADLVAVGVMNEARERGLQIGRDLSIIGFDNAPLVEYFTPALTTLEQRIPEVGHILIDMVERMFNGVQDDLVQLLVPPKFIIRESCGVPVR
jgi:DNA-binding LacI/PurR family transcriptional regulator